MNNHAVEPVSPKLTEIKGTSLARELFTPSGKANRYVERVLGRKPFTFDEWIQQNLAAFAQPVQVM